MRPSQLPYLYQRVFVFLFAPTPYRCVGAGTGAVIIPLVFSSSWTLSLRVHCRHGWRHPPSPCKEPEGRTRRTKRVVAPSAPFRVSRPTIAHPKSVSRCPQTSSRSVPSTAGPGLRLVSALRRRRLHPWPLGSPSALLHSAFTPTPGPGCGEQHRFPAPGAPPRVSSRGGILGFRVSVSRLHLCKGSRVVALSLSDLPILLARLSMLAPRQLRLCRCSVPVGRGAVES